MGFNTVIDKQKKDKCVSCGVETQYDEFDHIDFRNFYVEGAGQLCCTCFNEIYNFNNNERVQSAEEGGS